MPFIQKTKPNLKKYQSLKKVHFFLFFGALNTLGLSYYLKHIKREDYEDELFQNYRKVIIE